MLWLGEAEGGLPASSQFDLANLSATYPLLARVGVDVSGKTLMWCDVANAVRWPFKTPVKNRPVVESVPNTSAKRVVAALNQTLTSRIPDYYETTTWRHGGETISLARLAVPVKGETGIELIASWEIIEPFAAS